MKSRVLAMIMILVLTLTSLSFTAFAAAYVPPTSYGKPLSPGVVFNHEELDENPQGRWSFILGINASDEIRSLLQAAVGFEDSTFEQAGYNSLHVYTEWDYKIDSGKWRYELPGYAEWVPGIDAGFDAVTGVWASDIWCNDYDFEELFTDGILPGGKAYFDSHTISFRVRFNVSFYNGDSGQSQTYYSPWSDTVSYSNKQKAEDPKALINHAPKLLTADLKYYYVNKEPYLDMTAAAAPSDIQKLNSISGGRVFTNVWIRVNGGQWKDMGSYLWMKEKFEVNALDYQSYFNSTSEDMDAVAYEVKFRYEFDQSFYPAAGAAGTIYSPFSNVISHGTPAYSNASAWAEQHLQNADKLGILTDRLRGQDMTLSITREEFAELAVKFYEMVTKKTATAGNKSFLDTTNVEILKAANLNITAGVGDGTKYEPKSLLPRQQMATMIVKTLQACYPTLVLDISGQPDFKDQASFAKYAIDRAKFMAKYKITVGDGKGSFIPLKNCSRQEAITFLVQAYQAENTYTYSE